MKVPDYSELLEEGEKFYICAPCVPFQTEQFHHTVATVKAKSVEEAAVEAHEWIIRENDEGEDIDPGYMDTMYVLEFDPTAVVPLRRGVTYEGDDDALQCCFGWANGDHTGNCPFRPRDE
jgi:hypothetical protein